MILFSVVTDFEECRKLWQQLSPNETLFELWEYRESLFDPRYFQPHFIVGCLDGQVVGLLPLWKVLDEGCYELFGGYFTERNRFFVRDKQFIPVFLREAPDETVLSYIEKSEAAFANLTEFDNRYFIDLASCNYSLEEYFSSFSSKHRKNLRRDLQQLESLGCRVHFNRLEDYSRLCELNKLRFGTDSFFAEKHFVKGFDQFTRTAGGRKELQMISIEISGVVEAVEVAVLYNGVYSVLMGGNNIARSNIGKLMIVEHIKNAIANKARTIDFLSTDNGWKKLWKLSEEPVYLYENTLNPSGTATVTEAATQPVFQF